MFHLFCILLLFAANYNPAQCDDSHVDEVSSQNQMVQDGARAIEVYSRYFCQRLPKGNYSLGECKNYYASCNGRNRFRMGYCDQQRVYENGRGCVSRSEEAVCNNGNFHTSHKLCKNRNGQTVRVSSSLCCKQYGVCDEGTLFYAECPQGKSYSETHGCCIPDTENHECYRAPASPDDNAQGRLRLRHMPLQSLCPIFVEHVDQHSSVAVGQQHSTAFLGACNSKFVQCADGEAQVHQCLLKDHAADASLNKCLPKEQSKFCTESPAFSAEQQKRHGDYYYVHRMQILLQSSKYCKGKEDGLYLDPYSQCHQDTVFCFKGLPSFHRCPSGTGVDFGQNDRGEWVLDETASARGWCKRTKACQQQEQNGPQCGDDSSAHYEQHLHQHPSSFFTTFAAEANLCQRQEVNGVHVFGLCQNFHGQCKLGKFEIVPCDDPQQIYDPLEAQCRRVRRSDPKECRQNTKEQIAHTPAQKDEITDNEKPEGGTRCYWNDDPSASKPLQLSPCSGEFSVCTNNWETTLKCDNADYVFSDRLARCVQKVDHPECQEYKKRHETTIPKPVPIPDHTGVCQVDGAFHEHEKDCTLYYRCAHGRLIQMSCPSGTAFEPSLNVCNHKNKVQSCKEKLPY